MSEFNNGDVTDVLDSFFIDYAIDEDDDDEANVQELMQQRSDMSEAVNEWYVKAKAFDDSLEAFEELRDFYEKVKKTTERSQIRAMIYKEVYSNVLREMKLIYEESGESDE